MFALFADRWLAEPTAAWLFALLADISLRGFLILVAALLLGVLSRGRSAAVRHLIWLGAVAALLIMPVLSSALPAWRVLPDVHRTPVAAVEALPGEAERPRGGEEHPGKTGAAPPSVERTATAERRDEPPVETRAAVATPAPSATENWDEATPRILVTIWAIVVAGQIALLILGGVSLWRVGWRARRVTSGPLADLLHAAARRTGVRRRVELLVSDRRTMPMTWGIWRPKLLLPGDVDTWSEAQTRMVLLHELAHIQRGDCATRLFVEFARIVYWFHPLPWIARRRIEALRERACDDLVLSWDCPAAEYAEHLVRVSTHARAARWAGGSVAMARQSTLEGRVRSILSATQARGRFSRRGLAVALLLVGITLPAAMLATRSAADEPAEPVAQKDEANPKGDEAKPEEPAKQVRRKKKSKGPGIPDQITIVGTCVDENGKPVADARVRLFFVVYKPVSYRRPLDDAAKEKVQRQLQDVRTDAKGQFRFAPADGKELREKNALLNVVAQAKGKATAWNWPQYFGATKEVPCEFKLEAPQTLSGRVTSANDKPVAGVVVSAGGNFCGPFREPVPGICTAVTDADGRYKIDDLRPWDRSQQTDSFGLGQTEDSLSSDELVLYRFGEGSTLGTAIHAAYARQEFDIGEVPGTIDIMLQRPADVAGRIVLAESGKPAANARVEFHFEPDMPGGEGRPPDWLGVTTTTDAEGRYRIDSLWPERYLVKVFVESRPKNDGYAELKPGDNRFDRAIGRGGTLQGHFIDVTTGQPLLPKVGLEMGVSISRQENAGRVFSNDHAEVGADGLYRLNVAAGQVYVSAGAGEKWSTLDLDKMDKEGVYVGEGQTVDYDIRVRPRGNPADKHGPHTPPAAAKETPPAEQAAIAEIYRLGGWVKIDKVDGAPHVVEVSMDFIDDEDGVRLVNDQMTDESLAYFPKFTKLQTVSLTGAQITDKGMAHLRGMESIEDVYLWEAPELTDEGAAVLETLPKLKFLLLEKSKITDETLRRLSRLPKLTVLILENNNITDKGLEFLKDMKQLERLAVGWVDHGKGDTNKQITDAGMQSLAGLTNLEDLDLQSTAVTDAGLVHLRGLKRLENLDVGFGVTEAGLDNLRLSIPKFKTNISFGNR